MAMKQPWIASAKTDLGFIVGPAFVVTAIVVLLKDKIALIGDTPPWLWLLLIVGVDVSHVYSTIFRTYLDKEELQKRQMLYTLAPLAAWIVGVLLYSVDALAFWRALAYLAVFHFVRQQYGFMMIYARGERERPKLTRHLDQAAIYLATLFPIAWWHCHKLTIQWFMEGDFFYINKPALAWFAGAVFAAVMAAYAIKEVYYARKEGRVNVPKNLLLLGTALSWSVGIVIFNNDLAFTATNVIAHGIPYTALIWIYGRNQRDMHPQAAPYVSRVFNKFFTAKMIPVYLCLLFALAFIEEGVWDGFVWREHGDIFGFSQLLPQVQSEYIMVWLVPLLSLPQSVHYVLDAFIWKHNLKDSEWKKILLHRPPL
jgi:hypothetical protein